MNGRRRAKLKEARAGLLEVRTKLGQIRDEIDLIRDEEDDARENMPENLQYSERYVASEDSSRAMENAASYINDAIVSIDEAI